MNKYLLLSLLIITCSCGCMLHAQSARERYDFQYILELYEKREDSFAIQELSRFRSFYPHTSYGNYLEFIEASITLRAGDAEGSRIKFIALLEKPLSPEIKADVMLGAVISSYQTAQVSEAESLIQKLISRENDPQINASAYSYRALIQTEKKLLYSAELSYRSALSYIPDMNEAKLQLFQILLLQEKQVEAAEILYTIPAPELIQNYAAYWMEYLLAKAAYTEFDSFIQFILLSNHELPDEIKLIIAKQQIILQRYQEAQVTLDAIAQSNPYQQYFRALLLSETGKTAAADSLLIRLSSTAEPELTVLSYLQRLRLLSGKNLKAAISQLKAFIDSGHSSIVLGEQHYLLALFYLRNQDQVNALKHLNLALKQDLDPAYHDQAYYLIAIIGTEVLYVPDKDNNIVSVLNKEREATGVESLSLPSEQALYNLNRYLNLFPSGKYRDQAWFYLGHIYYMKKDYREAQTVFSRLMREHPNSPVITETRFYLAEIEFNRANYQVALAEYIKLIQISEQSRYLFRAAQSHFYSNEFEFALSYINRISSSETSYEITILHASTLFNLKRFDEALKLYQKAEKLSGDDPRRITETKSYQAMVFYQLKRFKEASKLYYQLSGEALDNPSDPNASEALAATYLYLSAKSSFLSRDYHQAIRLYDTFIDSYPESKHFLSVLAELANIHYNMAHYDQAVELWTNIISRYANKMPLSEEDIKFLTSVFSGLELSLRQADNEIFIDEIIAMLDSIKSDFMRFEMQFILLRIYADRSLWQELYAEAESIRQLYPQKQRLEVEYLMADALINLNEYERADSLLTDLAKHTQNSNLSPSATPETLTTTKVLQRLAELDMLQDEYASAFQHYHSAFLLSSDPKLWTSLLQLSHEHQVADFDSTWALGELLKTHPVEASVLRLDHLFQRTSYAAADSLANEIIEINVEPIHHAKAFLTIAKIKYATADYNECLRMAKQLRSLFPDYPSIIAESYYYSILSLIQSELKDEAKQMYLEELPRLNEAQKVELDSIFSESF